MCGSSLPRFCSTMRPSRTVLAPVWSCVRRLGSCAKRTTGSPAPLLAIRSFQPVAQRAAVAALEAPLRALALSRLDQVLQTPRPLHRRLAALSTTPVALHPQLVFPLPRNPQMCKLVFDTFSHFFRFRPVT